MRDHYRKIILAKINTFGLTTTQKQQLTSAAGVKTKQANGMKFVLYKVIIMQQVIYWSLSPIFIVYGMS